MKILSFTLYKADMQHLFDDQPRSAPAPAPAPAPIHHTPAPPVQQPTIVYLQPPPVSHVAPAAPIDGVTWGVMGVVLGLFVLLVAILCRTSSNHDNMMYHLQSIQSHLHRLV